MHSTSAAYEGLFENAFHYASIGMALVAPSGSWLKVNRALCAIVGYSEEEMMKLTFQDVTHADDLDADLAHVRDLLEGRIETYWMEKRYIRKDAKVVWVHLSVSLVREPDGRPKFFISQIKDITERKNVEIELRTTLREKERLLEELESSSRENNQLREQIVVFCAWTRQIKHQGRWMPPDEFLIDHLKMKITHGMSDEGAALFLDSASGIVGGNGSPLKADQ